MNIHLPFWQRLIATIGAMLAASYLIGLAWQDILGFPLPNYIAGAVGGLTALPIWHLLKRMEPPPPKA